MVGAKGRALKTLLALTIVTIVVLSVASQLPLAFTLSVKETTASTTPQNYIKLYSDKLSKLSSKILGEAKEVLAATLVTGDKVYAIKDPNGRWAVFIKPAEPGRQYRVLVAGKDIYVIPVDVDLKKFSIDLFNIRLLDSYRKLGVHSIPLIVVFKKIPGEGIESIAAKQLPIALKLPHMVLHIINAIALRVPPEKAATVYHELASSPVVAKVALDRIVKATAKPTLPQLYRSVPFIGAPKLWEIGVNGSGIKIAILDTGIDSSHPDFYIGNKSKIIAEASFVDFDFDGQPDEPPSDGFGHGTHCAGIAAGAGNYMPQIKGVAPGALLLNGKVLSNEGWGYDSWIIKGIEWAVNNSVDIISMSLGGLAYHGYDPLVEAVNKAYERGIVVVVAAGNEGPGLFTIASPGVAEGAITVGAYDIIGGAIAWFSSRGPTVYLTVKPDVVAPGVDILSARASNTWMGEPGTLYHVYASGTSMATPHVAGYAALVIQLLNKTGILSEAVDVLNVPASHIVKDVIVSTATGYDQANPLVYGIGIINASNLLNLVENKLLIIPEPARKDILLLNNTIYTVTLKLFNPFNETRSLIVKTYTNPYPGAASIPADAVKAPEYVTVEPHSATNITITIDASKLPVGVHALKLFFVDNATGVTVAKALIGLGKPALAVVNVYYNGTPVEACADIEALDLASGSPIGSTNVYGGFYGEPTCGTGSLTVGPLLPNKAYLLHVYYENETLGVAGDYYYPLIIPSTYTGVVAANITVDFAKLPKVNIVVPETNNIVVLEVYNDVILNVTVGSTSYELETYNLVYTFGAYSASLTYGFSIGGDAKAAGVKASVVLRTFAVKSTLVPLEANPARAYVFYREYQSIPFNTTIIAKPSIVRTTMLHIHSTIGRLAEDYAGLALFCGSQEATVITLIPTMTGSLTAYMIDSEASCDAIALDYVELDTIDVLAYSWWSYSYNGYDAYAPLAFPVRLTTLWNYMFAYQGLDGYNFSGAYFSGNVFRTWLTGYLDIESYYYPLFFITVAPNGKQPLTRAYYSSISPVDLYWIADNTTPPSLYITMTVNTTLLGGNGLSFAKDSVVFKAVTETNATYVEGITVYEFGFGVGGRDVIPLYGYDPLFNMVPNGSDLVLLMLFNEPIRSEVYLNTSSVRIALVSGNITIPGIVLDWYRLSGIPLPYAIVVFPTSSAPAGKYELVVSAQYYDNSTGSKTYVYYRVGPAVYVGIPAGEVSAPIMFNVSLASKLTSITGQAIRRLLPGSLTRLNISYSLVGFNGTAKILIEIVRDGETIGTVTVPLEPGTQGSVDTIVFLPWKPGTYRIKVYLVLDNTASLIQVLP